MNVTLGNTIGAALLGAISASVYVHIPCLSTFCPWLIVWPVSVSSLFGITMVQVYTYYHNFPKDWKVQKYAVCLCNPANISTTLILTLRSKVALLL